jgi:hypothetical protein
VAECLILHCHDASLARNEEARLISRLTGALRQ